MDLFQLDFDGDGQLSYEEFRVLFEKGSKEINPENLKYSNSLSGLSIPSPINLRLLN